jgi:hypothetical protein
MRIYINQCLHDRYYAWLSAGFLAAANLGGNPNYLELFYELVAYSVISRPHCTWDIAMGRIGNFTTITQFVSTQFT